MPRASWRGFLRLSLVSCPVYLSPATTRAKPIRLHQVWQAPVDVDEDQLSDRGVGRQGSAASSPRMPPENSGFDGDQNPAATRATSLHWRPKCSNRSHSSGEAVQSGALAAARPRVHADRHIDQTTVSSSMLPRYPFKSTAVMTQINSGFLLLQRLPRNVRAPRD